MRNPVKSAVIALLFALACPLLMLSACQTPYPPPPPPPSPPPPPPPPPEPLPVPEPSPVLKVELLNKVPRASVVGYIRQSCLSNGSLSYGAIFDRLVAIGGAWQNGAHSNKQSSLGWFLTPSGFAVATPFERISDDGTPISTDRWSTSPFYNSLWQVLTHNVRPGRYRAFLISYGTGMTQEATSGSLRTAESRFESQGLSMSNAIRTDRGGLDHYLQIFVYEYRRPSLSTPAMLVRPGLPFATHLERAGLQAPLSNICRSTR